MNITADAVKQLRERTGAGMMECKKALVETKGDLDAAAELMRKQGLAKADRKAARVAAEGVVVVSKSAEARTAAMVEV
ncbi:MAG: translation elongation factor Ts, partial [Steroidobacteraceae bacterium]